MIETIDHDGRTLAIIIRAEFREPGITFFTPSSFSQQLAFMRHPAGKAITPHLHNPVHREVDYTQEVLLIRCGLLRVDFYDGDRTYLHSRLLRAGDVILLASGGHNTGIVVGPERAGASFQVRTKPADHPYLDAETWSRTTPSRSGSWWPEWTAWLHAHSGGKVEPPRIGGPGFPPLANAPGRYVLQN